MYLLGVDVGSSSVKASLVDAESGQCVGTSFFPKSEAPIHAEHAGWAEQDPQMWWDNLCSAVGEAISKAPRGAANEVAAIGISYQMHGLVCIDKERRPLRPSIIWCDSRAVGIGNRAFDELGHEQCLTHMLNSPGNFTASKLRWVKENEPQLFEKIYKIMLPGDYIAMKMTGEISTTISGLSEGTMWDFKENSIAHLLLNHYGISADLLPEVRPTFSQQGVLTAEAAAQMGLQAGVPVTYRAGDQPNNALSLGVFNPGEIASTAGTSGVVYGVNGKVDYDKQSRVNSFAHVNHSAKAPRIGVLLCVNGTGILNSWIRRNVMTDGTSYPQMNDMAEKAPIGSEGLSVHPFGNGAERMLNNKEMGCNISGLNFNIHSRNHIVRAAQEGIVFSFKYGIKIMEQMGLHVGKIHAGNANMFLSPIFRETLASVCNAEIELYDTDGSVGAAKGAGMGAGIYKDEKEAFATLGKVMTIGPDTKNIDRYVEAYDLWESRLNNLIK